MGGQKPAGGGPTGGPQYQDWQNAMITGGTGNVGDVVRTQNAMRNSINGQGGFGPGENRWDWFKTALGNYGNLARGMQGPGYQWGQGGMGQVAGLPPGGGAFPGYQTGYFGPSQFGPGNSSSFDQQWHPNVNALPPGTTWDPNRGLIGGTMGPPVLQSLGGQGPFPGLGGFTPGTPPVTQQGQGGPAPQPGAQAGGPPIPAEYLQPTGPVSQNLFNMFMGGPNAFAGPQSPFVGALAQGQIPQAALQQYQNEQNRQFANISDAMGGARFGSDFVKVQDRAANDAFTQFQADMQNRALQAQQSQMQGAQNAMQNFMGVANPLLNQEQQNLFNAFQMQYQEYLRSLGLPPELQALMQAAGMGGPGTQVTSGGGPNLTSQIISGVSGLLNPLAAKSGSP